MTCTRTCGPRSTYLPPGTARPKLLATHPSFLRGEGISVVRHHHERWDGAGYPDRLEGTDTPLGARIFAVADALDAMTSDRPYRRALPWDEAAREIAAQSGRQFDPAVVTAFVEREPRFRAIHAALANA